MNATEPTATTSQSREQRIRELAYQIWETEGRPEGQESRHWELANKLADVEASDDRKPAQRTRRLRKPHEAELPEQTPQAAPMARKRATKTTVAPKHDA